MLKTHCLPTAVMQATGTIQTVLHGHGCNLHLRKSLQGVTWKVQLCPS